VAASGIPYCDYSWNPYSGCDDLFPCVKRCWARKMSLRLHGRAGYDDKDPFKPTFHADKLCDLPKKPSVIAACFMGDLWCDEAKKEWQDKIIDTAINNKQHQYLFLTKRDENFVKYIADCKKCFLFYDHIWFGVSITSNKDKHRVRVALLMIENLYLSIEPCLEVIDVPDRYIRQFKCVIIGCESGTKPRPMPVEAAYKIAEQCERLGVPLYVKQLTVKGKACTDINLWPKDLRIQQLPWRDRLTSSAGVTTQSEPQ